MPLGSSFLPYRSRTCITRNGRQHNSRGKAYSVSAQFYRIDIGKFTAITLLIRNVKPNVCRKETITNTGTIQGNQMVTETTREVCCTVGSDNESYFWEEPFELIPDEQFENLLAADPNIARREDITLSESSAYTGPPVFPQDYEVSVACVRHFAYFAAEIGIMAFLPLLLCTGLNGRFWR